MKHSFNSSSSLSPCPEDKLTLLGSKHTTSLITPVRSFSISRAELSLPAVLKCGQTFRWNQSKFRFTPSHHPININPATKGSVKKEEEEEDHDHDQSLRLGDDDDLVEWSMAWTDRTIVLRQDDHAIHYCALYRTSDVKSYELDLEIDTTYGLLKTYFVLDVSLVDLYRDWSQRDPIFSNKVASGKWDGLRVCRQDSWETMVSFICSSNNNIPRISLMLNRLCSAFGDPMPIPPLGITLSIHDQQTVEPSDPNATLELYSFPTPQRLSQPDVLERLKLLGFGYRANYVYQTSIKLCEIFLQARREHHWPGFDLNPDSEVSEDARLVDDSFDKTKESFSLEPQDYLEFLSRQTYPVAHSTLVNRFAGIGPKVGDCICLFGLGFVHVIPVDVHIYKIALRDYKFELVPSATTKRKASRPSSSSPSNREENRRPGRSRSSQNSRKSSSSSSLGKSTTTTTTHKQDQKKKAIEKIKTTKLPGAGTNSLSKLNYLKIQEFLLDLWGPWAGWAQQILFLADLNKPPT